MNRTHRTVGSGLVLAVLTAAAVAQAEDYFLTIGGGYSPTGNQISLEKNVLFFRQLLAEHYPQGASHTVYFSDGKDPGRDLQYADPQQHIPPVYRLLAQIFPSGDSIELQYRTHDLTDIEGPSSRQTIEYWFDKIGSGLRPNDRLFIYATAHGGKSSDNKKPGDTTLMLWNREQFTMHEFEAQLDKIPAEVPVVLVMVQCYSGGFAHVIFDEGDSAKGCTTANRCGFFATVEDRPAAGCTPDIHEENYQEYSSYFWSALRGRSRTGEAIESCDYDGDGVVSLQEAHAYALLASDTIDISVRTSDAFLRAFSRNEPAAPPDGEPVAETPALLTADAPYDQLLAVATASDRAVLTALSRQLGLDGPQRASAARAEAQRIDEQKRKVDGELRRNGGEHRALGQQIARAVTQRWPELGVRWHPQTPLILEREGQEVAAVIQNHASYPQLQERAGELQRLNTERLNLDRRWAKCQRLIRGLEHVALAANLPLVATPDVLARYQALVTAESTTLGPASAVEAEGTH